MKKLISIILILFAAGCHDTSKIVDKPLPDACIPLEETCNNLDDDCDGKIDEQEDIAIKPCYEGDSQTLLYGICRFGVERCVDGGSVCLGQITPQPELCNGVDDNCNGSTDEIVGTGIDLLFVIDYSPSMSDKINMINTILLQWSTTYIGRTNIKIGLIGAPDDNPAHDKEVVVMLPLSDIPTFITTTRSHVYAQGSGNEPTLDAVYLLADRRNPLGINWTPDYARAILLFSDEPPQSYCSPAITETIAMNTAITNNVNVFVFTNISEWRSWIVYPINSVQSLSDSIDQAIQRGMCK